MRRYKLAQFEAFRAIVSCGSFQGAAERLNVTQPTISLRIRELESALGHDLFDRDSGRVALTSEGHVFLHYADRVIDMLDELDRRMISGDPLQGVLRLGASDVFAISCLSQLLSRLERTYPHLRVELTISWSTRLAQMLDARLIDIAFMSKAPQQPHVEVRPLATCPLAWFASTSQYDSETVFSAADVARRHILTVSANTPLYRTMVAWFETNGQPVPVFSTCNDLATVLRLVRAGHAWSVLPVCFAMSEEASILPAPVRTVSALPALLLCSAFQAEVARDTLLPVVEMAMDIIRNQPGFAPM
ncbi:MAG: LysR family transcriptional regulator [Lautropia sp.]